MGKGNDGKREGKQHRKRGKGEGGIKYVGLAREEMGKEEEARRTDIERGKGNEGKREGKQHRKRGEGEGG